MVATCPTCLWCFTWTIYSGECPRCGVACAPLPIGFLQVIRPEGQSTSATRPAFGEVVYAVMNEMPLKGPTEY
jgi:hypothetical protein